MKYKYITGATASNAESDREKENREIAYLAALEGIVLLKNDGTLPVMNKKIALFGAGAMHTSKGGVGSGEVNERKSINIYEGLRMAGFSVSSEKWLKDYEIDFITAYDTYVKDRRAEGRRCGFNIDKYMKIGDVPFIYPEGREITEDDVVESDTDTALYVITRQAGEAVDRKAESGEFELTAGEARSLEFLSKHYKNTVLVINSGAYVSLSKLDGINICAIIYFCQQGSEGGRALADIISGKVSPSGKLSFTWVNSYSDIPFGDEFGKTTDEYYREGIYVGYRYFESFDKAPRYPFGFGLSYTRFDISLSKIEIDGTLVRMSASVKNIGKHRGKEVAEVYITLPKGELHKEKSRLVAFGKTKELAPEECVVLDISFDMEYAASYDDDIAGMILEGGEYIIKLGSSSDNALPVASVTLDKTAVLKQYKNICLCEKSPDAIFNTTECGTVYNGENKLYIYASDIQCETFKYKRAEGHKNAEVDAIMEKLSVNDMVELCVGVGMLGLFRVGPVAALGTIGATTSKLYKKGLINVNLSDGPAGLRLLRRSAVRGKTLKMIDYMMSFFEYFPRFITKALSASEKRDETLYQYCTAFPVGTALAMSWNTELCERVGEAISREMDEFLVTYWLAPAMNIQRNPLCGRNFEYYSEDPVVSGKIAAALVRGIQKSGGNYATVKHFACNNRENDRRISNSVLSERALREIYLRGFEICVKESSPRALMTSYNLVNGTYTPNSYDLINEVLRCEWGFDGVVITDWYSTERTLADNGRAIAVGNDLIMQGGGYYKREIKKALREGKLTEEELRVAASNIVAEILNSRVLSKAREAGLVNE